MIIHYYIGTDGGAVWTTACDKSIDYTNNTDKGYLHISNFIALDKSYTKCQECLSSEDYKNDLFAFEVGYENNSFTWHEQVVQARIK